MAVSLRFWLPLFFFVCFFFITQVTAQYPSLNDTDFSCSADSPSSCQTYVAYLAQSPEFLNLANISRLFGVNGSLIADASNLVYEDGPLRPNQLLLVPITCGCTGSQYFANTTYQIKQGDSYYLVSITSFENLTNWHVVEQMNPNLNATSLQIGVEVTIPLFCKCPSKRLLEKGIQYLLTYVWQPNDNVSFVGAKLNASPDEIVKENRYRDVGNAVSYPVLIPVSELPALPQFYPFSLEKKWKISWILIVAISIACSLLILASTVLIVYSCRLWKKRKVFSRSGSSLETTGLIPVKELTKSTFETKIIQDKLLSGVSGYLGKPIMYDVRVIMEATMNLTEHYRIGRSVYKANINGKVVAVKQIKEDVTEELRILQKVNHANLVKLMGISSDPCGNGFLVYEYAENGSLDKWLYPKSSTSSGSAALLTWSQRLHIALDVANGLQYMHEHTRPSIVHRDIRTSNILLNSRFKAKIANFSLAAPATNDLMPKFDVFAFGVVLLELLSGKKVMGPQANANTYTLLKEISAILETEEMREEKLSDWMDPNLESFYPIDGALSLAILARACTLEMPLSRPSMAEIVFSLTVLTQSSETLERSWKSGFEAEEVYQIISPVRAR